MFSCVAATGREANSSALLLKWMMRNLARCDVFGFGHRRRLQLQAEKTAAFVLVRQHTGLRQLAAEAVTQHEIGVVDGASVRQPNDG